MFEIWEDKENHEITMCYSKDRETSDISKKSVLIKSFNEPDYDKAMTAAHEFLGFEAYVPFN